MTLDYNTYIEELLKQQMESQGSPYQNLKRTTGKIYNTGDKLTTIGNYMQNLKSPALQKVGANIGNVGSKLTSGASKVNNVISPQNYFKGFAPRPFDALSSKLANGAASQIAGNTAGNVLGSELGNTAVTNAITQAAPMATASGLGAGAAAGTAAEAGTAAATGAATGAAAGGGATGAAMSNPITALVALGVMAATGANRKRAKKSSQALLSGLNKESENALEQTNQFAQNAVGQDYSKPALTGAASPVQQLTPLQEYQEYLRGQGYDDNIVNGVAQGLNGGNKEIDDWIKQYNAGAGKDNPINIPQTDEEIAAAKAGTFNVPTQAAGAEENLKKGLLDKFLSGLGDLASGYQENLNSEFKPENLQRDSSKSKMNRLGEAVGTLGRVIQKPAAQALLAGGLSAALTGNPLYGLGQAYKFGNNRAMSNVYENALREQGIDVPNAGLFGNYDAKDFGTLMTPQYKEAINKLAESKLKETELYHEALNQERERHNKEMEAIQKQNADTNAYKAKNGTTITHVGTGGGKATGGGSKGGNKGSGKNREGYYTNLAKYRKMVESGASKADLDKAYQAMKNEYGTDFEKEAYKMKPKNNGVSDDFLKEIGW